MSQILKGVCVCDFLMGNVENGTEHRRWTQKRRQRHEDMQRYGMFRNYRESVARVEAQGRRMEDTKKGCEIDVKIVWDQLMKVLWTRFCV